VQWAAESAPSDQLFDVQPNLSTETALPFSPTQPMPRLKFGEQDRRGKNSCNEYFDPPPHDDDRRNDAGSSQGNFQQMMFHLLYSGCLPRAQFYVILRDGCNLRRWLGSSSPQSTG
jgi:hypothetical protein